jgi:hypothetical protein
VGAQLLRAKRKKIELGLVLMDTDTVYKFQMIFLMSSFNLNGFHLNLLLSRILKSTTIKTQKLPHNNNTSTLETKKTPVTPGYFKPPKNRLEFLAYRNAGPARKSRPSM